MLLSLHSVSHFARFPTAVRNDRNKKRKPKGKDEATATSTQNGSDHSMTEAERELIDAVVTAYTEQFLTEPFNDSSCVPV